MMKEWLYANDLDDKSNRPELTIFSLNILGIPLLDYMRMALDVSKRCGMRLKIEESEDRYRFDFYLHGSVVMGRQISEWCDLIGGSELFVLSVCKGMPQTIRVSCYRMKQERE